MLPKKGASGTSMPSPKCATFFRASSGMMRIFACPKSSGRKPRFTPKPLYA